MMASVRARVGDLAARELDLLVIGGGITGAGVLRDAAMRGLRAALVERADFGAGTSSRSSRLIHGGLRYLEHRQWRLVFEALRERSTLLRLAPHLSWDGRDGVRNSGDSTLASTEGFERRPGKADDTGRSGRPRQSPLCRSPGDAQVSGEESGFPLKRWR